MFDYHSHGHFSFDCDVDWEKMVQAAIAAGLKQMAFTDHFEPEYPNPAKRVYVDLHAYENNFSRLRGLYGKQIELRKGLELGLQPGVVPIIERRLSGERFDFLIASFHYVDDYELCDPRYFSSRSPREAYRRFYTICLDTLARYDDYDVMGHVNIIDRYAPKAPPMEDYIDLIREIFALLIGKGKGIEFNSSCFRYAMGGVLTPSLEMLSLYRKMGGKIITVGSDAHRPEDVGAGLQEAYRLLSDLGFSSITLYEERKPAFLPLDAALGL